MSASLEWPAPRAIRDYGPTFRSNPTDNQENDNDYEDQPQSSGRSITPVSAV
jgi:hypothetical protein